MTQRRDFVDHTIAQWVGARADVDPAPLEIVQRVLRIALVVGTRLDDTVRRAGLRVKGDYQTLAALRRNLPNPLTASALADEVQVSASGLTGRLDRLEGLGLVRRVPDPADRRSVIVELTDDGERLVDELYVESVAVQREVTDVLTAAEAGDVAAALRRMLLALGDRAP